MSAEVSAASYRDAAGFVFRRDGVLYRQVNDSFRDAYDAVEGSGLYAELAEAGLLVAHREADVALAARPDDAYRVLRPDVVEYISYPYEWCFSELKDAALLTLEVQLRALTRGLVLRDASAYNVQFVGARPVFIDTLSFAPLAEGQPWYAYRQFCEHFLAPLALMSRRDVRLGALHGLFPDGVPLDMASSVLGARAMLRLGLALHVRAHATAQKRFAGAALDSVRARRMSPRQLRQLAEHLRSTVEGLTWSPGGTVWADYEQAHNYSGTALSAKAAAVREALAGLRPRLTFDLGANTGTFSRIAADLGSHVVALDGDPGAVELLYCRLRPTGERRILPLVVDLRNPSPASGWGHRERSSLAERGPADAILALALVHHLTLGGTVPLPRVAEYFALLGRAALVEFVPMDDPQARRLVAHRPEVPHGYSQGDFERAFGAHFEVAQRRALPESGRVLYTLVARGGR
ncbi:MAG TPA: hypothetical protein VKA84_23175 [Gemmatimonadaceae bacterium]|nr:hypothetical protein [Gemmatimonadaceae bacterium]